MFEGIRKEETSISEPGTWSHIEEVTKQLKLKKKSAMNLYLMPEVI